MIIKEIPSKHCDQCGCVFEFDNSDAKEKTKVHREDVGIILPTFKNVTYTIGYVKCPICGYEIEIWGESK